MKAFSVLSIQYFGELGETLVIGQHEQIPKILSPKLESNHSKGEYLYTVSAELEHFINGKIESKLEVKTTYLLIGLDLNNRDRELQFLTTLIMRAFFHLTAILAAKAQDAKTHIHIPENMDFKPAIERTRTLLGTLK